ncbi:unnamed protein product [Symbiodinium necroappetens]|uniref:Palmitoyltransferase n=1 Tax=Symbiodinium necroappetens TaxID=1628268 RepID=A0A812LEG9_9DINO|nr:unnamed protein product [Symbiodinium necroappetens]
MAWVQIPLFCRLQTWPHAEVPMTAFQVGLATVTVVLMGYCAVADPGQLKKTRNIPLDGIDLEQGDRPFRAHESWQYDRKIRRYDHYCKWVNNTIGLLNHREFVLMLVCREPSYSSVVFVDGIVVADSKPFSGHCVFGMPLPQ